MRTSVRSCRKQQRMQEVAMAEAALLDAAQLHKVKRSMEKAAGTNQCVACMSDVSVLEGLLCPQETKRHFFCDECFDGWVRSECVPAAEHVPKEAGEVWCMCKASRGSDEGCASKRPFSPQVRSRSLDMLPPPPVTVTAQYYSGSIGPAEATSHRRMPLHT